MRVLTPCIVTFFELCPSGTSSLKHFVPYPLRRVTVKLSRVGDDEQIHAQLCSQLHVKEGSSQLGLAL